MVVGLAAWVATFWRWGRHGSLGFGRWLRGPLGFGVGSSWLAGFWGNGGNIDGFWHAFCVGGWVDGFVGGVLPWVWWNLMGFDSGVVGLGFQILEREGCGFRSGFLMSVGVGGSVDDGEFVILSGF